MSVEKGVVISGFQKDYELMSWNEQGEITQVEGMLTIAFLVISPCSHRGNWKQLYCIIKITYLVNMPINQESKSLEEELEKEKERLIKLWDAYQGREKEIKQLSSEIEKLGKEKTGLEEILFKKHSQWERKRDMVWRINPITKKREEIKELPIKFDESNVYKLGFYEGDSYRFRYYHSRDSYTYFTLPISLYEFLCGREPKTKKESEEKTKTQEIDINTIQNLKDMRKFIVNKDEKARVHRKYFNQMANYLISNRGEKIKTQEIISDAKIPRGQTLYDLLHDFERWGFIRDAGQSYWKVDF